MHWNQIKSEGANFIFKSLAANENLKVIDISWNSIGNGNPSVAAAICEFLVTNKEVIHMDMSNNKINYEESLEIEKALKKNRTIYGFHYVGNCGRIDNFGTFKFLY